MNRVSKTKSMLRSNFVNVPEEVDVRVVGHPLAPIGMGEHVRSVFRAFDAVQHSVRIVDIYGMQRQPDIGLTAEFQKHITSNLGDGINLFCINGDEVEQAMEVLEHRGAGSGYNIIYPAWELERYPAEWAKQLDRFDEIWAPSKFISKSLEEVTLKSVVHMPLACEVKGKALRSRKYFSIPDSSYAFLFFFDFLSYLERKNPFAVLKAFQKVVEQEPWPDTVLVVKINNSDKKPDAFQRFLKEIELFKDRVIIIDKTLSDGDMKSLVSLCDCFVSLHRSEGFGRGLSEAMYLGKPVIATGYSGNIDFCSPANSFLVDFELIAVGFEEYPHWKNQVWADPDVEQAAEYMGELVADEEMGRKIGRNGQVEIFKRFSYRACGLRYQDRVLQVFKKVSVEV